MNGLNKFRSQYFVVCVIVFFINLSGCTNGGTGEVSPPAPRKAAVTVEPTPTHQPEAPSPTPEPKQPVPLATFSTQILDRTTSRLHNLKTAAEAVNDTVIQPGEEFSFNSVVGKRSADNGYKKATILVGEERKLAYGGGVCQISSTLYNAVLLAKLKVTERHGHTKDIHYVPVGKDAAVTYEDLDFKFVNTSDVPVKINVMVENSKVFADLYSLPR